jgi:hypothetical protein
MKNTFIQLSFLFLLAFYSTITGACRCVKYGLEVSYNDPSTQVMRVVILGAVKRDSQQLYVAIVKQKYNKGKNKKGDYILIQSRKDSCEAYLSNGKWLVSVRESNLGAGLYSVNACGYHRKWKNMDKKDLDFLNSHYKE